MTVELTEDQYIDMFGVDAYQNLCVSAFKKMKESDEFKAGDTMCSMLLVYPYNPYRHTNGSLSIECTAKRIFRDVSVMKTDSGDIMASSIDFGIVNMWLSDEVMPDIILDRYNEYKKAKK